ncbi:antibiotic biosynthesis monooxygenase [Blastococcus sp. TML/M2B]|uniref:antibiotic biosynthesis monooxygenase family protein n=1 Tax=unclassified Blastococcus TaxID=2619396 RepID=UPI00190E3160|nr:MULTISPECIES: antibiotic biosynthesis monooxygenase [unclassified Blastococcus]MBN1093728.1 antibiotic biosynthesis monooxygenase [Blastococcus sp. TML/M2B]MBN1096150.1 antibiotic biosynthesis monooxygenase [Blastococcus sp. TML/C7B]
MILEHALLTVREGEQDRFEAAFGRARRLIAASPGFRGLRLSRCLERGTGYLLLVEWDSLEAHTEGFRGSPAYQDWKAELHSFYEPFPVVEHFTTVLTAAPGESA